MTLLIVCDFRENWLREGRNFLEAFTKLHVPLYCEGTYFKSQKVLGSLCTASSLLYRLNFLKFYIAKWS